MNLRALAVQVLYRVIEQGVSLSEALPDLENARDQAFVQAICYGVCRQYFYLTALLQKLLDKPLKTKDQDVFILLLVGLYQLTNMRVPAHAAVAETVAATKSIKKIWAKGLVNAVLRNYQRGTQELLQSIQKNLSAVYAHPEWMIEKIQSDWPDEWENILAANNQHPPFALRVNQRKISRECYLEKIDGHIMPETHSGIILEKPIDVREVPGFFSGEVSVQDGAAQLTAELLDLAPEQRVLDACAAPGGKAAHILEMQAELAELVAIDKDQKRLNLVGENLQRLQLSAKLICADVADVNSWWDGQLFDRILLDAPCSASGVIRRHPDIKLLRRSSDISKLAQEQLRLLTALWPLLRADGLLVYATCSIFAEENVRVLESFLATHANVKVEKITASWGKECLLGRQILPGMHEMDGFYFASLKKLRD